jgi:hypothetical protein
MFSFSSLFLFSRTTMQIVFIAGDSGMSNIHIRYISTLLHLLLLILLIIYFQFLTVRPVYRVYYVVCLFTFAFCCRGPGGGGVRVSRC